MKKLISRRNFLKVCALAGSAAALSACGGKSTGSGDSAAAAVDVTGAVTFPLSEKVTFTGMTSFPVGSEPEPNNRTIFKRLEEQTNVHIDWTAIQSDQWSDKITLNMSNPNTLTDFVFTADFTDSNLLRYADQGVIVNLEDYIDYQSYGERRVQEEGGLFGDRGYVAYLGTKPEMNEIMARNIPAERMEQGPQMGGLT